MKMAYCTLLSSENYLDAVLILNKSLQDVNSKYPLFVMVTEELMNSDWKAIFDHNGILWTTISPLKYSPSTSFKFYNRPVLNTASKLQIFFQYSWDKLLYLDADTLILHNIDHLFEYPDGSMLKYDDDKYGFSGLFIIEPLKHEEGEFYLTLIKHEDCFDGDLLGKLWFFVQSSPAHQIPERYMLQYNADNYNYDGASIIHYCNEIKPWFDIDHEFFPKDNPGADLYRQYLSQIDFLKNF